MRLAFRAAVVPRGVLRTPGRRLCATEAQSPTAAKDEIAALEAERETLVARLAEAKDLAHVAKTRHAEDLAKAAKYAHTSFAKEMVSVVDNLQRAADGAKDAPAMKAKVTECEEALLKTLAKFGVEKQVVKEGDPFNPEEHEAMFQVAMPGKEAGSVLHVVRPGYRIHDRTLRATQVGVVAQ